MSVSFEVNGHQSMFVTFLITTNTQNQKTYLTGFTIVSKPQAPPVGLHERPLMEILYHSHHSLKSAASWTRRTGNS